MTTTPREVPITSIRISPNAEVLVPALKFTRLTAPARNFIGIFDGLHSIFPGLPWVIPATLPAPKPEHLNGPNGDPWWWAWLNVDRLAKREEMSPGGIVSRFLAMSLTTVDTGIGPMPLFRDVRPVLAYNEKTGKTASVVIVSPAEWLLREMLAQPKAWKDLRKEAKGWVRPAGMGANWGASVTNTVVRGGACPQSPADGGER